MSGALHTPHHMTVEQFAAWDPPADLADRRWELVDGEPVCMAPPTDDHGAIQSETNRLIANWLAANHPLCRVIITPSVIPRVRADTNERIPDLGITCSARLSGKARSDHIALIEILSPSNEPQARANVWAYCTIPTVQEIILLSSTSIEAEVFCRLADGNWPYAPKIIANHDALDIEAVGYRAPLSAHYSTTSFAAGRNAD